MGIRRWSDGAEENKAKSDGRARESLSVRSFESLFDAGCCRSPGVAYGFMRPCEKMKYYSIYCSTPVTSSTHSIVRSSLA